MERYELVIVGGGMSGLTLLAALRPAIERGLRVVLIDPASKPDAIKTGSPSFDDRATALSAQTLASFAELQVTGLEAAVTNIERIEVSDKGHLGYHDMAANSAGFTRFGAVIANRTLGNLLWSNTQALPIHWQFESEVATIKPLPNGHRLSLTNGDTLEAGLVLLCDGGRSSLPKQLGIPSQSKPFHASARVAQVKTRIPHQGIAFERFCETGPIALLPFGAYSSLVWTIPDQYRDQLPATKAEALPWLNQHFGQRLGEITDISDWHEYPLTEKTVQVPASHGVMVLGNSAATLHPVAGQGFNLAIRGLIKTAALVNACWLNQQQIPTFTELNTLAQGILSDQQQTVLFSRELIHTFGSKNPLLQLGRGIGLSSLDRHPSFSTAFALASMGLLSGTPSLKANSL